jgi:hypothetical protein
MHTNEQRYQLELHFHMFTTGTESLLVDANNSFCIQAASPVIDVKEQSILRIFPLHSRINNSMHCNKCTQIIYFLFVQYYYTCYTTIKVKSLPENHQQLRRYGVEDEI